MTKEAPEPARKSKSHYERVILPYLSATHEQFAATVSADPRFGRCKNCRAEDRNLNQSNGLCSDCDA
jgi:hypothetical protein